MTVRVEGFGALTLARLGALPALSTLFQLHEEQNEDRPNSNREGKLHHGCIAQRPSSGQRKCKQHHGQRREHAQDQFAFRTHKMTSLFFLPDLVLAGGEYTPEKAHEQAAAEDVSVAHDMSG